MPANVQHYLYWWQLPLLGIFIVGWLLGGGYLLLRSMAKQPLNPPAKLPRCIGAAVLAGLAGLFAGSVLYTLLATIGRGLELNLGPLGAIVAVAAMIAVGYLVIYAMFNLPFGNVLRAAGPAIFGTILLAVVIGAAAAIPARYATQAKRRRERAIHHLQRIHRAILMYEIKTGRTPKTLSALADEHYIDALSPEQTQFALAHEALHCALSHFARRQNRVKHRWDMACDFAINPMLINDGLTPPVDALYLRQYEDMTAEEIYPCLEDNDNDQERELEQELAKTTET